MRIDILAIGSRGDVQPFVALGLGLTRAGHDVRLVTLGGFEQLIGDRGLRHSVIGRNPREIADSTPGRHWVEKRASTKGFLEGFVRVAASLIEDGISNYWRICHDVDAIIVSGMGILVGIHVAERLRIPLIRAEFSPFARTHYDWTGRRNLLTAIRGEWTAFLHSAFRFLLWSKLRSVTNTARGRILSLRPIPFGDPFRAMDRNRCLALDAYSPRVVPRPPDWGEWVQVTGYWFLGAPAGWEPPPVLMDFLASGSRPVFVGFGSTPFPDPEAAAKLVVRSLQRTGHRGIVVAGGSNLPTGSLTDDIISLDSAPHDWLFSRVSAAVHHGGAGVTGATLRAGLPSVIVPVFADQPFWAERVYRLGASAPPIPAKQLTEDALTNGIQAADGDLMRRRAAALGDHIRAEDGVSRAVRAIHTYLDCPMLVNGEAAV